MTIIYEGELGIVSERLPNASGSKTFPIAYIPKGRTGNGLFMAKTKEEAMKAMKELARPGYTSSRTANI
jgi:hypothetical protein